MLLALPAGKLLERILPTTTFRTFRYSWSLNPGPFNIKEHVVITVMANIAADGAYASDIIATQRLYYGQVPPYSYQLCVALSMQMLGYSFAGLLRPFLVWPAAMIWPSALVTSAVLNTLHRTYHKKEKKHIYRLKFFSLVVVGSFLWYWVPGYLWTGLSMMNWACWIAPRNVVVNQLFGTATGLGMGLITLDWTMIAARGSPLVTPVRCPSLPMGWSFTNDYACSGGLRQILSSPSYS